VIGDAYFDPSSRKSRVCLGSLVAGIQKPYIKYKKGWSEVAKNMQASEWKPHAVFATMQNLVQDMYKAQQTLKYIEKDAHFTIAPPNATVTNNKVSFVIQYTNNSVSLNNLECWPSEVKPK